MLLFKSTSFYLAIIGIIFAIFVSDLTTRPPPPAVYVQSPSASPYAAYIAASGIVESTDKNIDVGTPQDGIIEKLWVTVGDHVNKGDPLFIIDTRNLNAQLIVQKAQVAVAEVTLKKQVDKLARLHAIQDSRAISQDELQTLQNEVNIAQAQLDAAKAIVLQTEMLLDRLTVRAPEDGDIIQVAVREGRFVSKDRPIILLGDVKHLQMRISIDEQNAGKYVKGSAAVAFPKNNIAFMFPLHFVRIEPYVIPKKSLTGSSSERTDTRVLEVLYSFEQPKGYHMYVGQQADVYIERKHDDNQ